MSSVKIANTSQNNTYVYHRNKPYMIFLTIQISRDCYVNRNLQSSERLDAFVKSAQSDYGPFHLMYTPPYGREFLWWV